MTRDDVVIAKLDDLIEAAGCIVAELRMQRAALEQERKDRAGLGVTVLEHEERLNRIDPDPPEGAPVQ